MDTMPLCGGQICADAMFITELSRGQGLPTCYQNNSMLQRTRAAEKLDMISEYAICSGRRLVT
jgi:hypothetical protein